MAKMVCVGPALPGMSPFYKGPNGLVFDGQNGRMMDYGHTFDPQRGYRVFFKFRDSPSANTWGGESLLKWCDFEPADEAQIDLQKTAKRLAHQVIRMNREWERLGKPAGGIPMTAQGKA